MNGLGLLEKFAVASILLLDLSNLFFVPVWIFLDPIYTYGRRWISSWRIHGFYVSNIRTFHKGARIKIVMAHSAYLSAVVTRHNHAVYSVWFGLLV